jgi:hypothetical protein
MSRWLVSHVPSWPLLLLCIVIVAGGAVLILWVVQRRFPHLRHGEQNEVTMFAFGFVGFVFAILVSFVVSALWSANAETNARAEGAAGVQLARDLKVFDEPDRDRIRDSLLAYHRAVVAEWPVAADGGTYPDADAALDRLYATYRQVQAHNDIQKRVLDTSLTNLDDISQARTERLMQARMDTGPPPSLWVILLLTSVLLLACAIIYGVKTPVLHYAMVASLGVLVAAQLFLVLELSYPFIGEIGTSPQPLRQVVQVLTS